LKRKKRPNQRAPERKRNSLRRRITEVLRRRRKVERNQIITSPIRISRNEGWTI